MRHSILLLLLFGWLSGCMKHIADDPQLQAQFEQRAENLKLVFHTDQGRQVAYYLPPLQAPQNPPEQLVIMYPGINSIALGWLKFIKLEEDPRAAYLLIEYPNRGLAEGSLRPEEIYQNSVGALRALAEKYGVTELSIPLSVLGHSFGAGMALQFAAIRPVERIVLVAPFNDLKEGVKQKSWLLAAIMPSQVDNRQLIKKILREERSEISILHGRLDRVLPLAMGQELAQLAPGKIDFYPFAEEDHTSILTNQRELIFTLLLGVR